jgi:L-malate glycosyltransferase
VTDVARRGTGAPSEPAPGTRLRIGIIGPLLGVREGWVTSQGEVLAAGWRAAGHEVVTASSHPNWLVRLADTLATIVRRRGAVDVWIIMTFSGRGFAMADAQMLLARATGRPVVAHLHGGNLPDFTRRHVRWGRRVLRRAVLRVAPSAYLRSELAHLDCDVVVIPNVVDLDDYDHRHRSTLTPRILWMRTFHELYAPELAIDVLVRVLERHPDAELTMAGQDKGLLEQTRAHAAASGVADKVRFPGLLDPAGKRREMAAHDLFLNTNRVDNMPVSVVEAGAAGLPIVATAVGGIPFLLDDGNSALLTPAGDADALADAVCRLLADPELAARLSQGARAVAERSSWPAVRAQWDAALDAALPTTARRR